jgi:hypothetical protein
VDADLAASELRQREDGRGLADLRAVVHGERTNRRQTLVQDTNLACERQHGQ